MHTFTRRGLRSRSFPDVTQQEIATFLSLGEDKQFEDLRSVRYRAAHLSGGSPGAFTTLYVGVIRSPFRCRANGSTLLPGPVASPLSIGLVILIGGCWIAYSYAGDQRDMVADAATRLASYEETLESRTVKGGFTPEGGAHTGECRAGTAFRQERWRTRSRLPVPVAPRH